MAKKIVVKNDMDVNFVKGLKIFKRNNNFCIEFLNFDLFLDFVHWVIKWSVGNE